MKTSYGSTRRNLLSEARLENVLNKINVKSATISLNSALQITIPSLHEHCSGNRPRLRIAQRLKREAISFSQVGRNSCM